jgi:hypothetical protein
MRPATVGILLSLLVVPPLFAGEEKAPEPKAGKHSLLLAPVRYAHERLADLADIFELNVGIGRGAKLDIKYGIQFLGLGNVRSQRYGLLDRRMGTWRELDDELALLPLSYLAWPVREGARLCGWRRLAGDAGFVLQAGTLGVQHLDRKALNGDNEFLLKDTVEGPIHTRWADSFPLGLDLHAGVGIRAVVRPLQLADFVVGFVGIELDPWLNTNQVR